VSTPVEQLARATAVNFAVTSRSFLPVQLLVNLDAVKDQPVVQLRNSSDAINREGTSAAPTPVLGPSAGSPSGPLQLGGISSGAGNQVVVGENTGGGETSTNRIQSIGQNLTVTTVRSVVESDTARNAGIGYLKVDVPVISSRSFVFEIPGDQAKSISAEGRPQAVDMEGRSLPTWLRFDSSSLTFSAQDVPSNALPIDVKVTAGSKVMIIRIENVGG
jgi:hypothetical protein